MNDVVAVTEAWAKQAWIDKNTYEQLYRRSIEEPEAFWGEQARELEWMRPFNSVKNVSFDAPNVSIRWFEDGELNICANCVDRHLKDNSEKIAIIWEGDDPQQSQSITYRQLYEEVCRFANALRAHGVNKGDRVIIYMPMIPEAAYAMLACARIGAIHSVVFGGFSPESLVGRIQDCQACCVITADEGIRGGRSIPMKANVDAALVKCETVDTVFVVRRTGKPIEWVAQRDIWYHEARAAAEPDCLAERMNAEDPLFVLYTSGSTGKPKGVLHSSAGYLLYAALTHRYVFDYHPDDIYWCTADVGWITGHSYVIYGPLANGATTLMFEGVPHYPDASRFWQICDKHKVSIFYTAPTAVRALMREGESPVKKTKRNALRLLGTVGEPMNPEAWRWYHEVVGEGRCPIMDTWWQTETGGILITPLPGATDMKPGSVMKPFLGVKPAIVDSKGQELEGAAAGALCIADSWPGQMRTLYGNHEHFVKSYFSLYPGKYCSGDGCRRDEEGDYWITGRMDDVINVSGHRMGTAEIESALVLHSKIAEAAVVGCPHDIKGQGIYAYVTLCVGEAPSDSLKSELIQWVRKEIGPIASPDHLQWSPALPKTRSGKIMRRILRKIAANDLDDLGDVSTLADPSIVDDLVKNRSSLFL